MSDDNLLMNATTKIFEDLCDPQNINATKDESWKQLLWNALEDPGSHPHGCQRSWAQVRVYLMGSAL